MGKVQQQAKTDVRTPERHDRARDFMRFVAENDADLRRPVRKNVTYDEEVLEDAFAAAVIKVHDSILAGRFVRDYRKYLFIAAKWEYVKLHNRKRRLSAMTVPVDAASGEVDAGAGDEVPEAAELVAELRRRISLRFGRTARMLYELRRGGTTFAAIGRDNGVNPRVVASIVRQVEDYVTSAPEMVRLKKDTLMPYLNKPKKQRKPTDSYSRARRMDIYNTSLWRQMRRSQLMNHPLCQVCEGCGRTTMAVDVHHIVSFTGYEGDDRKAVAFDRNNLVSLCKGCHQAAHHGYLKGAATVEEMVKRAAINLYR